MKICPACNKEYGAEFGFCGACGGKLTVKQADAPVSFGINLGDKNVISGEVIGHKEDIRVSGNATIIRNEDQTREVKTCGFCGKNKLNLEGVVCQRCRVFVCSEHFDRDTNQCLKCQKGANVKAEQQYMALLQEVMSGKKLDVQGRRRLDEERRRLNLTEDKARTLENNYRDSLFAQRDTLGSRDRTRLDIARQALLKNFCVDEALSVLSPLYDRFSTNQEVRNLFLLAIVEKDPDQALRLTEEMRFDDLDKSLAQIESLVRKGRLAPAEDVLRQAHLAFGDDQPLLLARDAELSIEEYRSTKQAPMLDLARDYLARLLPDTSDPYVLVVNAYLEYTAGAKDALDLVAEVLREKKLPPFYLLRLRNRIGLADAGTSVFAVVPVPEPVVALAAAQPEDDLAELLRFRRVLGCQCNHYGQALRNGNGVAQDDSLAVAEFREAADLDNADGQVNLGWMYEMGRGVEQNYVEAVKWYRKAAEQGNAYGQKALGACYANGTGVEQDAVEAVKWYRKAAEQGNADGQKALGVCYATGTGVQQDEAEGVKWYRKAAEQGNVEGQVRLGRSCAEGVEKDEAEAVKWLRKAAEQGNAEGQVALAYMYSLGKGVAKDVAEAIKWLRKAAELGDAGGQGLLGWMYENGRGVTQNYSEAIKWYKKAADQGCAYGQCNLGVLYENGTGVHQDSNAAVQWYQLAADQGNDVAKKNLQRLAGKQHFQKGLAFRDGNGVAKDDSLAVAEFRKAAELDNAHGQVNLGWMYEMGRGVEQSHVEAAKWYRLSAERGNELAKINLDRLSTPLQPQVKVLLASNGQRFQYVAVNSKGGESQGVVEADSQAAAIAKIRGMQLYPMKVTQINQQTARIELPREVKLERPKKATARIKMPWE